MKNAVVPPMICKEAFTAAREKLGLSIKELSQKTCLSVRQIEQIEDGGQNSFYSTNIKFTAAKKVAEILKLTPEEAFDFGDLVSALPVTKQSEPAVAVKLEETPAPTIKTPKLSDNQSPKVKHRLAMLGLVAIAGFAFVSLQSSLFGLNSETTQTPAQQVKAEVATPAESASPAAPEKMTETVPAPTTSATPPAASSAAPSTALAIASAECPVADTNVASFKTDVPKKSADMVYLVAKTPQVVCVLDATGKSQPKQLEPGIGASVYGKAPLKVLTTGLTQVDLYFQGVKVRPSNPIANTVMLEPAPLNVVKGEADSELR
ncbi:helix-turn-helix domain-containing protein [Polynucleobacter sp. MWH-P3-07-1]|uniref:helix-turn-helix domain-containing protein n=1 Tax=Polynucleobacter sp. MWH-P3-07-1 TaxID=1743173 RepID=UPI001BFE1E24|nr:helix-turn-helix domain-containing protein [Polynucleobacter sp. MWH-P3-07-1]QWD83989.1 helix-turn-helix domain-containing protein [Polynucleobacter sp. MWH-P3-07-1]